MDVVIKNNSGRLANGSKYPHTGMYPELEPDTGLLGTRAQPVSPDFLKVALMHKCQNWSAWFKLNCFLGMWCRGRVLKKVHRKDDLRDSNVCFSKT